MELALGIFMGLLMAAAFIVAGVLRYGVVFPRLGRWLDPRLYRLFPRAGHLFVDEDHPAAAEAPPEPDGPDEKAFGA
jgi:hypothetical protein